MRLPQVFSVFLVVGRNVNVFGIVLTSSVFCSRLRPTKNKYNKPATLDLRLYCLAFGSFVAIRLIESVYFSFFHQSTQSLLSRAHHFVS